MDTTPRMERKVDEEVASVGSRKSLNPFDDDADAQMTDAAVIASNPFGNSPPKGNPFLDGSAEGFTLIAEPSNPGEESSFDILVPSTGDPMQAPTPPLPPASDDAAVASANLAGGSEAQREAEGQLLATELPESNGEPGDRSAFADDDDDDEGFDLDSEIGLEEELDEQQQDWAEAWAQQREWEHRRLAEAAELLNTSPTVVSSSMGSEFPATAAEVDLVDEEGEEFEDGGIGEDHDSDGEIEEYVHQASMTPTPDMDDEDFDGMPEEEEPEMQPPSQRKTKGGMNFLDRAEAFMKHRNNKRDALTRQLAEESVRELTFKPRINESSPRKEGVLESFRKREEDRNRKYHERQEAARREEEAQLQSRPKINLRNRPTQKRGQKMESSQHKKPVHQRLHEAGETMDKNRWRLTQKMTSTDTDGSPLFTPRMHTSKDRSTRGKSANVHDGDALYLEAQARRERADARRKEADEEASSTAKFSMKRANAKSAELVRQRRVRHLQDAFHLFIETQGTELGPETATMKYLHLVAATRQLLRLRFMKIAWQPTPGQTKSRDEELVASLVAQVVWQQLINDMLAREQDPELRRSIISPENPDDQRVPLDVWLRYSLKRTPGGAALSKMGLKKQNSDGDEKPPNGEEAETMAAERRDISKSPVGDADPYPTHNSSISALSTPYPTNASFDDADLELHLSNAMRNILSRTSANASPTQDFGVDAAFGDAVGDIVDVISSNPGIIISSGPDAMPDGAEVDEQSRASVETTPTVAMSDMASIVREISKSAATGQSPVTISKKTSESIGNAFCAASLKWVEQRHAAQNGESTAAQAALERERQQCTFTPALSERSRKLDKKKMDRLRSLKSKRAGAEAPPMDEGGDKATQLNEPAEAGEPDVETKAPEVDPEQTGDEEILLSQQGSGDLPPKSRTELLFFSEKEKARKIEELRLKKQQTEEAKLTFKPTVIGDKYKPPKNAERSTRSRLQSRGDANKPVYERLYAKHNANDSFLKAERKKLEAKEVEGCTFQPDRVAKRTYNNKQAPTADFSASHRVTGFNEQISRMRNAKEEREKQAAAAAAANYNDSSYRKSREVAAQGAVPFKLETERRREARSKRNPRLYLDVNMGKRKGRLGICEGDNPDELAAGFAKVYSLDNTAKGKLRYLITETARINRIRLSTVRNPEEMISDEARRSVSSALGDDTGALVSVPQESSSNDGWGSLFHDLDRYQKMTMTNSEILDRLQIARRNQNWKLLDRIYSEVGVPHSMVQEDGMRFIFDQVLSKLDIAGNQSVSITEYRQYVSKQLATQSEGGNMMEGTEEVEAF